MGQKNFHAWEIKLDNFYTVAQNSSLLPAINFFAAILFSN